MTQPDELAQLAARADALSTDDTQPTGAEPEDAAPTQTNADIIAGAFSLARDTAGIVLGLKSIALLTDDKCRQLGELWGRVADKRGWNLAGYMGAYVEELTAVLATVGIVREVAVAVLEELRARQAKPIEAEELKPA